MSPQEDLFEHYVRLTALGMRQEAKEVVAKIVASVSDSDEQERWTSKHLDQLPTNGKGCIQYDLYRYIVFPSLRRAFDRGEAEASYLLGNYWNNLVSDQRLFEQAERRGRTDFFRIAFSADPSSERYRSSYLGAIISNLEYAYHEWPTGILIDPDEDWRQELADLESQLVLATSLDKNGTYTDFIAKWSREKDEYAVRLAKAERTESYGF